MDALEKNQQNWAAFIRGDEHAFHELYKTHYAALINYATKLTGQRSQANEYVIETLIALWHKRAELGEVTNVRSYLISCIKRTIYQTLRADKRRTGREEEAARRNANEELSYEDYLAKTQMAGLVKKKLMAAMTKLTDRQKELLELRFFEGLDYDEIASKCGISKRTAYNIIFDAVVVLKKEFRGFGEEGADITLVYVALFLLSIAISST